MRFALDQAGRPWQSRHVPDTEGNGFGSPNDKGGCVRRHGGFFTSTTHCCASSLVGRAGKPSGLPVPLSRSSNPARARHPRLEAWSGIHTAYKGTPAMRNPKGKSAHSRFTVYNFIRRFAGPALAYRLSFIGRAA